MNAYWGKVLSSSHFSEERRKCKSGERHGSKLVNVRKLVALDITLHGPKFILAEFGIATPVIIAVGLTVMFTGPFFLGLYLSLTGINYAP